MQGMMQISKSDWLFIALMANCNLCRNSLSQTSTHSFRTLIRVIYNFRISIRHTHAHTADRFLYFHRDRYPVSTWGPYFWLSANIRWLSTKRTTTETMHKSYMNDILLWCAMSILFRRVLCYAIDTIGIGFSFLSIHTHTRERTRHTSLRECDATVVNRQCNEIKVKFFEPFVMSHRIASMLKAIELIELHMHLFFLYPRMVYLSHKLMAAIHNRHRWSSCKRIAETPFTTAQQQQSQFLSVVFFLYIFFFV